MPYDKTLRELQTQLPWTIHYHRDFRSSPMAHKDFAHALLHVFKAAGKLATLVNDAEHGGCEFKPEDTDAYVADLVICALRMANTCPGHVIDLQRVTEDRILVKNGLQVLPPAAQTPPTPFSTTPPHEGWTSAGTRPSAPSECTAYLTEPGHGGAVGVRCSFADGHTGLHSFEKPMPPVLRMGESESRDGGKTWLHDKSGEAAGFTLPPGGPFPPPGGYATPPARMFVDRGPVSLAEAVAHFSVPPPAPRITLPEAEDDPKSTVDTVSKVFGLNRCTARDIAAGGARCLLAEGHESLFAHRFRFGPGDQLECIDNVGAPQLVRGERYEAIDCIYQDGVHWVRVAGQRCFWPQSRFRLIASARTQSVAPSESSETASQPPPLPPQPGEPGGLPIARKTCGAGHPGGISCGLEAGHEGAHVALVFEP